MSKPDYQVFHEMRKGLGIRQIDLAQAAKVFQSKLSAWEHGRGGLNQDEILRVADALDAAIAQVADDGRLKPSEKTPASDRSVKQGKTLADRRRAAQVTQQELAEKSRIPRSEVSLFETGYIELNDADRASLEEALASLSAEKEKRRTRLLTGAGKLTTVRVLARAQEPLASPPSVEEVLGVARALFEVNQNLIRELDARRGLLERLLEELRTKMEILEKLTNLALSKVPCDKRKN